MLAEKHWDLEAVLRLGWGLFLSLAIGILVAGLSTRLLNSWSEENQQMLLFTVGILSFQGMGVVLIALFLRAQQTSWKEAFGLTCAGWGSILGWAVSTAVILLMIALPLSGLISLLLTWLGMSPEPQAAIQVLQSTTSLWRRCFYGFAAILLVPPAEELIFRGVLYPTIKQLGFPRLALWLSALLFALVHMNLQALVPLMIVAVLLTLLYEKTNNLLAPILAHSVFNAVNFLILFWVTP